MKRIVLAAIVVLGLCISSCGTAKKGIMLNAEFIKQYDTPGEKPYYTTHADGLYYSMCHTYGGFEYNLSVSGTLEQINHLYSTDTVDIIRINANERFATWGERSNREGGMEIKVFDKSTQEVKCVYKVSEYVDEQEKTILQFPITELYEDRIFFIDRGDNRDTAILMEFDISSNTAQEFCVLDEYHDFQPVLKLKDQWLMSAGGNQNDGVQIMMANLVQGEVDWIALPKSVARVHAIDYDTQNNRLCIYYATSDEKEYIGLFTMDGILIKDIYSFGSKYRMWSDDILCHGEYVLWNHYTKPKSGREELASLCNFIAYDTETDILYDFPGGFDFFFAEDRLYVNRFGNDRVHRLYQVDLP